MTPNQIRFHSSDVDCQLEKRSQWPLPEDRMTNRLRKEGMTIVGQFCITHNVEVCRCGLEWTAHVDFDKDVSDNIKGQCFLCNATFFRLQTIQQYKSKGNCCQVCINRCAAACSSEANPKITKIQATHLLQERIKRIKTVSSFKQLQAINKVDEKALNDLINQNKNN